MNKIKVNVILDELRFFVARYIQKEVRKCQCLAIKKLYSIIKAGGNKFLFDLCCGSGKSIIQNFIIFHTINTAEKNHKFAKIMYASHRLALNQQLFKGLICALRTNGIHNCEFYSLSSDLKFKFDNDTTITFNKFTKDSIERIKSAQKHIIVIACAASEDRHFGKFDSETLKNLEDAGFDIPKLTYSEIDDICNSTNDLLAETDLIVNEKLDKFFDIVIQDEGHKNINRRLIENFEIISKYVFCFTATPNRMLKKWAEDNYYHYGFKRALNDKVVVPGKLYTCVNVTGKQKTKCEVTNLIKSFDALCELCETDDTIPVYLNYFSTIDYLTKYAKTCKEIYGDTVDIAVFASNKILPNYEEGTALKIQCELNGEVKTRDELLRYCQERITLKPLIILSAFMIVEGIDIPSINGVGIWCDKNESNLFQAAARGCRKTENKFRYYIFTNEYLVTENKDFLEKLYNGFEGALDFGDGQDDCPGTGKTLKHNAKITADLEQLRIVSPLSIKVANSYIKEIVLNYKKDIEPLIEKNNIYQEIEEKCFACDTIEAAFELFATYTTNPFVDTKKLFNAINNYFR